MRQGALLPTLKAPVMDLAPGTFGMPGDLPGTKDRCGPLEPGALIGPIGFRLAQPPNFCNTVYVNVAEQELVGDDLPAGSATPIV
jgi:hypothetical protein